MVELSASYRSPLLSLVAAVLGVAGGLALLHVAETTALPNRFRALTALSGFSGVALLAVSLLCFQAAVIRLYLTRSYRRGLSQRAAPDRMVAQGKHHRE